MVPATPITQAVQQIGRMTQLSESAEAGRKQAQQVERALEFGFAQLMSLEARLLAVGSLAAAGDPDAATEGAELQEAIEALRTALTRLRLTSSPEGPSKIAYGFVLPRRSAA